MSVVLRLYRSTLGKKLLVALTGLILFGFLIAHVSGNLLVFAGPEKLNAYSRWLRENAGLLWAARVVLLGSVLAHIVLTIELACLRRQARPTPYYSKQWRATSYAARSMILSGPAIAAFVVYHLLHFTTGTAHHNFQGADVYHNVVSAFQIPWVAGIYIASMLLLSAHLAHGVWSLFQTLGVNHPKYDALIKRGAVAATLLIVAGFLTVPVSVLMGFIK